MFTAFINPPWVNQGNTSGIRAGSRWPHIRKNYFRIFPFPYRLAEATALLKKAGHFTILVDSIAEGLTDTETLFQIAGVELAVVETATNSLNNDINFLKTLRINNPKCIIVAVGQHASIGEKDLKPYCDYVFPREYDYKVRDLANGVTPTDVDVDVKTIPWPYRNKNTFHLYQDGFCTEFPNATVTTSRGCPYACTFCQEPTVFFNRPGRRLRDPADVVEEWVWLHKELKAKEIYIDDSTFTADEGFVHAILDEKEKRKLNIRFSAMGDARVSDELLTRLAKNKFTGLKIGVESIHPEILKKVNKAWLKRSDIERTVRKCRELGIFIHGTFILGLPGDTKETITSTVNYALHEPFNFVQFSPFIPLAGTKIYDEVVKNGWLKSSYDTGCNVIVDRPELHANELEALVKSAQARISRRVFSRIHLLKKYLKLAWVSKETNLFQLVWDRIRLLFLNS